ncbi:MAG: SDR family NAD(P)-dependent oxidoreductase [Planctomycetota bacterium]|jgi:3-oxoacyl-[acyl-carrier protein] reductase/pteridine reductase
MRDKTIVITGGNRGLGAELAKHFWALGARVHTLSRNPPEEADPTRCDMVGESCGSIEHHRCTIVAPKVLYSSRYSPGSVIGGIGQVDVLINNAGSHEDPFDVNFTSAWSFASIAKEHGATHIINIGSVAGQYHSPRMIEYSASKAAMHSLTKALARAYAPDVLVNCVAPGILDVGMGAKELDANPEVVELNLLKRAGTAAEVCRAVELCARAEFMTGQVIGINGGLVI